MATVFGPKGWCPFCGPLYGEHKPGCKMTVDGARMMVYKGRRMGKGNLMFKQRIDAFRKLMEQQFSVNKWRGGWSKPIEKMKTQERAFVMLDEARDRLHQAVHGGSSQDETQEDHCASIREASADVANCALIIADLANVLVLEPPEVPPIVITGTLEGVNEKDPKD